MGGFSFLNLLGDVSGDRAVQREIPQTVPVQKQRCSSVDENQYSLAFFFDI